MADKKKKGKNKEEKVYEIFEIEKEGKEKILEKINSEKEDISEERDIEKENKILRDILISLGIFVLIVLIAAFFIRSSTHFKYNGVKFNMVKEGELLLYHTSFPVVYQDKEAEYNLYLRNDPRELGGKVPAKGTLLSIEDTVINITEEFDCNGDEVIAIANLINLYNALGKDIMKDENASCDEQGRYMYLQILSGNETSIEKFGPNCYNININNCEILEGTERFIVGMLVKIKIEQSKK